MRPFPICSTLNGISQLLKTAFTHWACLIAAILQVDRLAEVGASVDGVGAKLLLDAQDLVELGETLRPGGSTSLDLSGPDADDDVGDGDILGLTRTVRDHDAPAVGVGVLGGLDGLGQGSDLVDLEQQGVGSLELDGLLDADGVGDSQVIPDDLDVLGLVEVAPGLPVILGEGVLDGDDGVLLGQVAVQGGELLVGDPLGGVRVGVLEVQVVLLLVNLVELGRGDVHGNVHLAGVASLLDGVGDELEGLLGGLDIGGNTTLISDVAGGLAVLLLGQALQLLVDLSTPAQGLGEGRSVGGDDHELLEGQAATGVRTAVEDVHERNRQDVGLLGSGEVGDVSVQRDALLSGTGLGNSQGDTEDGVGAELGLVGGAIQLDQEVVDGSLVLDVQAGLDQLGGDDCVDVLDGLQDTLAAPLGLVAITELASLVLTCTRDCISIDRCKRPVCRRFGLTSRCTGWDNGTVEASLGDDVNLNGGVATGVVDVASVDLGDTHVGCVFLKFGEVIMPQEEVGDVRQDGNWGSSGELGRARRGGWEAAYLE
ncbi:hypothetical protein FJTKL_14732 [Diaporthe vaccinii]|uniref:Uncharacterized protein n=1 Tax=Diaporthe vaccinii TaxID=105482 RepID=A0ABR4F7T5_9PEZI